jgi:serine/threonine protein phosphatase PrpC
MRFSIFQDTQLGARAVNQDRMGYCFSRESLFMILADGMGGHVRGEVAAELALQTCARLFQRLAQPRIADPATFLREALAGAHRALIAYQHAQGLHESPRTTVVACIVQEGKVWWAHAGDSRLYWMRRGVTLMRTRDHSQVQSLLNAGLIRPEQQDMHPDRNKVLNCLGSPQAPEIELVSRQGLQSGDVLLLCTDGVWAGLADAELARTFERTPVAQAVPTLVREAVARHGRTADNATALAMAWDTDLSEGVPSLSSLDLPEGALTTTIALEAPADARGAAAAADETGWSDDAIERQITEIRQAIQRSRRRAD